MKKVKHWFIYKRKRILSNRKWQTSINTQEKSINNTLSTTQETNTIEEEKFSKKNSINSNFFPQINNASGMQNPQFSQNKQNYSNYFHNNPQFYQNNDALFKPHENSMMFFLEMKKQILKTNAVNQLFLQELMNKQIQAVKSQQFLNILNTFYYINL